MASLPRTLLVCSCEDTFTLDSGAIGRACRGARIETARQLCRAELDRFRAAAKGGSPLTVGCTQEAPLFSEVAEEIPGAGEIAFTNIRELAGWSNDATTGPKIAALLAAAAEPMPPVLLVSVESQGVVLIYGRDEQAIEAGQLLRERLDVTVILTKARDIPPPRGMDFPVAQGTICSAKGHLGAFELTLDDYAQPLPSSRGVMKFGPSRNGASSRCDIILDLSGETPLFSAPDLRDGYVRADPGNPNAVLRAVIKAGDLIGTFDKPRYITFDDHLCAHARARIVGCRRCLDLCPTGAIAPAGDHVAIDPQVCAGCGSCAAACPTGAASYALPPQDALMRKLRTLLNAYRAAGGENPILLFHDESFGAEAIGNLARHGDGLPARVLPVALNEVTQVGLEIIAAAFAYGASSLCFHTRARPLHDMSGLHRVVALGDAILKGLGFGAGRVKVLDIDDPFALGEALRHAETGDAPRKLASFTAMGGKRDVLRLALRELHHVSPKPADVLPLPDGAPFGTIVVAAEGCTLCLSCVGACPTGALSDNPERPMLRFTQDACVQCGLCKATCPEKVISLMPQIDFRPSASSPRTIQEEEPFHCTRCGKPFGNRAAIERVAAKLEGKHWMFSGSGSRLALLKMCDDCRAIAAAEGSLDPYAGPQRPRPRTSDDYLRGRDERNE